MRAMICRQWGGPEDLRLEEVEPAPLKAGQVRIKIRAAGVSFATTLVIAGKYQRRPPFPFAPGTEASGVVTEATEPRLTSIRKLSGGTRRWMYSSLMATIVPRRPPVVTILSPVFNSFSIACHFFWRFCCGMMRRK